MFRKAGTEQCVRGNRYHLSALNIYLPNQSTYLNNHSAHQIITCQPSQSGRNVLKWKDLPYRSVDSTFLRQNKSSLSVGGCSNSTIARRSYRGNASMITSAIASAYSSSTKWPPSK